MKFNVSIIEYLGSINGLIFSVISIVYNEKYYECILSFSKDTYILTVDEELNFDLGYNFYEDEEYKYVFDKIKTDIGDYDTLIIELPSAEIE